MKKQLQNIFLSCLISSSTVSIAQMGRTQYFDGADSSYYNSLFVHIDNTVNNIWQVGKPQKVIFDSAATLPNAMITDTTNNYPQGNTSSFTFHTEPYMTHGILAIQWKQKLDMEKDHAGGIIEFSVDYGTTWQNAFNNPYVYNFFGFEEENVDTLASGEYAFSGTDSTWKDIWLCYNMSWLWGSADSVKVRFTFKSDSLVSGKEGWMIDNMNTHFTFAHPVKEVTMSDEFNVYPNPASNRINIQLKAEEEYHIIELMELIDSQGRRVGEWKNIPTRFWIETGKYPAGSYYLKIKTNLRSKTVPVMIQK
ncbi:MAG TPA: T9SS type A sorting domain-containing protein [Bacteroidia bacterium]|jgi:hypothetical protein